MKEIQLPISERLAALRLIDTFRGNQTTLLALVDAVKLLGITADEWTDAKKEEKKVVNGEGQEELQLRWDDALVTKTVTLDQATVAFFNAEIKKKSDANELTLQDVALINFSKKLD